MNAGQGAGPQSPAAGDEGREGTEGAEQVISQRLDAPGYRGVDLGTAAETLATSAVPPSPRPERIDLTRYEQRPAERQAAEEQSGHYLTGPIDPKRRTAPRRLMRGGEQLGVMVGHRLLVGITFLDEAGNVTNAQQFCGKVLEVGDGVVVVERPGEPEPAVLPADIAAYRKAQTGRYTLRDTGEIVVDPDFVSTWQVAAVDD